MVTVAIIAFFAFVLTIISGRINGGRQPVIYAAIVGLITGAILDYWFGWIDGMWYYTHHTWWSLDYFLLLYPAWALNAVITWTVWLILKKTIKSEELCIIFLVILVAGVSEAFGLWRDSWRYTLPWWLVMFGWVIYEMLLITIIRLVPNYAESKRRKQT